MTEMIDPFGAPELFISGLGEVEALGGGVYRFSFYVRQTISGEEQNVKAVALVAHRDAVPPAILKAAAAIGVEIPGKITARAQRLRRIN